MTRTAALKKLAVAATLREIGQMLRLKTADQFRSRAYSKAASAVAEFNGDLTELVEKKRLTEIKGVGESLAHVIEEVFLTGSSSLLERLKQEMPPGAVELSSVAGLSLSRIETLHQKLGISSIEELKSAIEAGKLRELPGFGEKTSSALLTKISSNEAHDDSLLLITALRLGEKVVEHMEMLSGWSRIDLAGAIRRWQETVPDIRITVMAESGAQELLRHFLTFPLIASIEAQAVDQASVKLSDGMSLVLMVAPPKTYWNLLHYETGSEAHLQKLAVVARKKGIDFARTQMKARGRVLKVEGESDIYKHLGMQYVIPELREDHGEIEAALSHEIPEDLITIEDIKGMVHCHTTYSDGRNTVEEMARAAEAMGMKYMTITDHSPTAHYANGLSIDRLKRQQDEIARVQAKVKIKLLRGTESDILRDGELDYPDNILEQFDVIIASIHNRYKLDENQMTRRVINAMKNPLFKIWGHPSGRLVGRRPPVACRYEDILDVIAESGAAIEISGDPHRLDMEPRWTREARKRGTTFVISTDAHSISDLYNLKFGIGIARRAGVRRGEVLNTLSFKEFQSAVRPLTA